jgi:hypothetical protein
MLVMSRRTNNLADTPLYYDHPLQQAGVEALHVGTSEPISVGGPADLSGDDGLALIFFVF